MRIEFIPEDREGEVTIAFRFAPFVSVEIDAARYIVTAAFSRSANQTQTARLAGISYYLEALMTEALRQEAVPKWGPEQQPT